MVVVVVVVVVVVGYIPTGAARSVCPRPERTLTTRYIPACNTDSNSRPLVVSHES